MKLTKQKLVTLIKEELEALEELAPRKGVYAVDAAAIAEAERLEKMYRDAGKIEKADQIRRAIKSALAGEKNIEQFHKMYQE